MTTHTQAYWRQTPSHIESMRAVHRPSWVNIVPRQGRYKGHEQLPYFGAILTEAGRVASGIDKRCTQCRDTWPADTEFFRRQPKPGQPHRLAPWCKACEASSVAAKRAIATVEPDEAEQVEYDDEPPYDDDPMPLRDDAYADRAAANWWAGRTR